MESRTFVGNGARRRGPFPENRTLLARPGSSLLLPREVGVEVVLITPMLRPPPPPTSSDLCFPSSALHPPSFILHPLQSSTYRVSSSLLLFVSFVLHISLLLLDPSDGTSYEIYLRGGPRDSLPNFTFDWSEKRVRAVSTNLWRLIFLVVSFFFFFSYKCNWTFVKGSFTRQVLLILGCKETLVNFRW